MITLTLRLDDVLIQGELIIPTGGKESFWRLSLADFHKKECCEIEATCEEIIALVALAMGAGEEEYDGYNPKMLYSKLEKMRSRVTASIWPVP